MRVDTLGRNYRRHVSGMGRLHSPLIVDTTSCNTLLFTFAKTVVSTLLSPKASKHGQHTPLNGVSENDTHDPFAANLDLRVLDSHC